MEAIILAGGLGTRLQGVIGAYPKCMAEVNGKPFLAYLLSYLKLQGCAHAIFSLGFKSEVVVDWLLANPPSFPYTTVVENEPLGTGGGIGMAMRSAGHDVVAVLNGDTYFDVNLSDLETYHRNRNAETTLALREMQQFDRYGVVRTDDKGVIIAFEEKAYKETGTINGGVYMISRKPFLDRQLPEKYSFEKDYLERFVSERRFYGCTATNYFIDIGIPEDYAKVATDFKTMFP